MKEKLKYYKLEGLFSSHKVFNVFASTAFMCMNTRKCCLPEVLV